MRRRVCLLPALLGVCGAPATAAEKIPAAISEVDKVIVYSTEARVFRTARIALTLPVTRVALADLPDRVIPGTVRVESSSAKVVRVAVIQTRGDLPRQAKAKELVDKIELVHARLQDLADEERVLHQELSFVESLGLRREPNATANANRRAPEGLFANAWSQILGWMEGRSSRIRSRLAALAVERRTQNKALHALKVEAKAFDPATIDRLVSRVVATLESRPGKHRVTLSYRVAGARWVPSYDLRYEPAKRIVHATYYAVVDQKSGEDWAKARLRFSTGLPTQLLSVPELPTLTLGRKRDFIPTPRSRPEPAPTPWSPSPPPHVRDPVLEHLASLLVVVPPSKAPPAKPVEERPQPVPDSDQDAVVDEEDLDSFEDTDGLPDTAASRRRRFGALRQRIREQKKRLYRARAKLSLLKETALAGQTAARMELSSAPAVSFSGATRYVPTESVPWSDVGYRGPSIHRDLPAAAAKGYRFTLYAPGRHTVAADGVRRRVPVLRRQLRVKPVYRVLPGATKRAYLVASVENTTGRPILRGHANLFSGTMFSGRSWLNTALPGKTIQLPLGVDDAIKVERHLTQKTVVQGVLFKDDVTEYTVQIEIANHHRYPIQVELEDQVPVKLGRKVEVKAFSSSPAMTLSKPDKLGKVGWEGRIGASSVKKLRFSFQIVRPKDWELRQYDG